MNDSQRQSLSHAIKAVLNDVKEFDVKFKHPFNKICTGPSQSGKSCLSKLYYIKDRLNPSPPRSYSPIRSGSPYMTR